MKTRDGLDRSKSKTEKPEDGKALLGLSLGDRRKKGKKKISNCRLVEALRAHVQENHNKTWSAPLLAAKREQIKASGFGHCEFLKTLEAESLE
uniref:Uncharacterized protein n=1 Tax=Candidozyma auris TaxID=498019 RepID=A0A0L0P0N9_CANAR